MFANTKDVDYEAYNSLTDMCDALCGPNKTKALTLRLNVLQ